MKKTIFIISSILLIGCKFETVPIEKYGSSKYVVVDKRFVQFGKYADLQLKNKDTIFWINVLIFDAKNINVGDTIK